MSVTVRNVITSMRLTSAFDWQNFLKASAWWMKFCAKEAISATWISPRAILPPRHRRPFARIALLGN